ncbi:MAG: hypothetical protein JEZ04_05190 [Spirochaetales bacterium]|nr:hypothetical protein [Spirochaetales bacterium]
MGKIRKGLSVESHYYEKGKFNPFYESYDTAFTNNFSDEDVSVSSLIVINFNRPVASSLAVPENITVKRLGMKDRAENNFNIIKGTFKKTGPRQLTYRPYIEFYRNESTFDWNHPVWNGLKPGYEYEVELSRNLSGECWRFKTADLEFGLYWFRDAERCVKYVPGRPVYKEYYDPGKPVLLYIHGWERTSVNFQKEKLKDFRVQSFFHFAGDLDKSMKAPVDLVSIWKKKYLNFEGREWNFGVLYWNQFSDDDHGFAKAPKNAESKIWTARGPARMRYAVRKQSRGKGKWLTGSYFSEKHSPDKSVSVLFADIISSALSDKRSSDFRLYGHSLGNQVITAVAYILKEQHAKGQIGDPLFPKRLAVADPYWCKGRAACWSSEHPAYRDLGNNEMLTSGQMCSRILKNLIEYSDSRKISGSTGNFALEIMSASLLTYYSFTRHLSMGDPNLEERDIGAAIYLRSEWIHPNEALPAYWGHKHVNALLCYLWQYAFPPPSAGFSASSCNAGIAAMMNYRRRVKVRYSQTKGMDRASPEQNDFEELQNSW